jgi:tetratricopeptide (TPR) repeat protein
MSARSAVGCHIVLHVVSSALLAGSIAEAGAVPDDQVDAERRCVALLNTTRIDPEVRQVHGGILVREIFRQAILIAARDELGASTRDSTIREPTSPSGSAPFLTLDAQIRNYRNKHIEVAIDKVSHQYRQSIQNLQIRLDEDNSIDYLKLVQRAEKLSRTAFVEALRDSGLGGAPNRKASDSKLSDESSESLDQVNFLSQFNALRRIHSTIRSSGESPETLSGLVRGYANLGLLTEPYWNASHKAFKARSLLYAQRLVADKPRSPFALRNRAYALALTGLHGSALMDLETADAMEPSAPKPSIHEASAASDRPEWVDVIKAYCSYDRDLFAEIEARGRRSAALAAVLGFVSVQNQELNELIISSAEKALNWQPDCFRVMEGMCDVGEVSHLHGATLIGPYSLMEVLPARLAELPDLPEKVETWRSAALRTANDGGRVDESSDDPWSDAQIETRLDLIKATLNAGNPGDDAGEPSWAVLARMVEEVSLVLLERRLRFMKYSWGVPIDEFLAQALPIVEGHPYEPVIANYDLDWRRDAQQATRLLGRVRFRDEGFWQGILWDEEKRSFKLDDGRQPIDESFKRAMNHCDETVRDVELLFRWEPQEKHADLARRLLRISPKSAVAVGAKIWWDWSAQTQELAVQWEKEFWNHPLVTMNLGARYKKLKQFEDAIRCLKRSIEISPELKAYQHLAWLYKDQGDDDEWKRYLDEFLAFGPHGLTDDRVRYWLARHFMKRGQWEAALPYAEEAAESWAEWAMEILAECYEGMGQWDEAEQWMRRTAERYPDSAFSYVLWCKRTGYGDADAARRLFSPRMETISRNSTTRELRQLGTFRAFYGELAKSQVAYEKVFDRDGNPYDGLHAATLADEQNDTATRDALLKRAASSEKDHPVYRSLADLFTRNLDGSIDVPSLIAEIEDRLAEARKYDALRVCYFVGRFLDHRGLEDEAVEFLSRAASITAKHSRDRTIAIHSLRTRFGGRNTSIPGSKSRAAQDGESAGRPTPLHDLAQQHDLGGVRVLLQAGADYTAIDEFGNTPVHKAAKSGNRQMVSLFIKSGAEHDIVTASCLGMLEKVKEFVESDPSLVNKEIGGWSPLHGACALGRTKVLEYLLDNGADINARDFGGDGWTPLHRAAAAKRRDIVNLLLRRGGDRDIRGGTPPETPLEAVRRMRPLDKETQLLLMSKNEQADQN